MNALALEFDDRRQVYNMLDKLHPARRIRFVNWCAGQCPKKLPVEANMVSMGSTSETYAHLMLLEVQYGLKLKPVLDRLAEVLKYG
jgi:hypothetical protein